MLEVGHHTKEGLVTSGLRLKTSRIKSDEPMT